MKGTLADIDFLKVGETFWMRDGSSAVVKDRLLTESGEKAFGSAVHYAYDCDGRTEIIGSLFVSEQKDLEVGFWR